MIFTHFFTFYGQLLINIAMWESQVPGCTSDKKVAVDNSSQKETSFPFDATVEDSDDIIEGFDVKAFDLNIDYAEVARDKIEESLCQPL